MARISDYVSSLGFHNKTAILWAKDVYLAKVMIFKLLNELKALRVFDTLIAH